MLKLNEAIQDGKNIAGMGIRSCESHRYMGEIETIDKNDGYVDMLNGGRILEHAWPFYEVVDSLKR